MSKMTRIANEIRVLAAQVAALPDAADATHHPEDLGLHKAEDIANHWHQRFLLLKDDEDGPLARAKHLRANAEGAKCVLDEIRAERERLRKV